MVSNALWITLCVVATVVSIFLYKAIDSAWATENNMTIVVTIAFFGAASLAVLCGFNAATSQEHAHGE